MTKKWIAIILSLVCLGLLVAAGALYVLSDRTGPEIRIDEAAIRFDSGMEDEVLLQWVTAYDEVDGDVTESLRVSAVPYSDGSGVKVTFIAKDSSNNITKVSIDVMYAGDSVETSAKPLDEGEQQNKDEDASEDEDAQGENEGAGEDAPEDKDEEEPQSGDIANTDNSELVSKGDPVIRLNMKQVSLPVKADFDVTSYIDNIVDDKDDMYELYRRVRIGGDYKSGFTGTAGTYNIEVYVFDTDGNKSNIETLVVIVE